MFFFKIAKVKNPLSWPAPVLTEDMRDLSAALQDMGSLIEDQIGNVARSLRPDGADQAKSAEAPDENINRLRLNIDRQAIEIVARPHLPIAELRHAMSAMRISMEFEQIARLARSIFRSLLEIKGAIPDRLAGRIADMADLVLTQIRRVEAGYAQEDTSAAFEVWQRDEEIDRLHNSLFAEILAITSGNTRNISVGTHLLFCIKNLERAGDHATNIAEFVYYALSGERILTERPKRDTTKFSYCAMHAEKRL